MDYCFYLHCLWEAAQQHCCAVHAYVLMPNHVHLLVTPEHGSSVSKMMQAVGWRYLRYVNAAHQRSGRLWERRYKAALIESDPGPLTCYRYIELKPVMAGMVQHPGEYRWSSYRFHAEGEQNRIVRDHVLYTALGSSDAQRQSAYQALFAQHIDPDTLAKLRETMHHRYVPGSDRSVSRARPAAAPG